MTQIELYNPDLAARNELFANDLKSASTVLESWDELSKLSLNFLHAVLVSLFRCSRKVAHMYEHPPQRDLVRDLFD